MNAQASSSPTYNRQMISSWVNGLLAWIGTHPYAAGAVIFLVAFCDALVVLGMIVPVIPLLIPVGLLIGMGRLSGPYALACAALGAFCGDGFSYAVGRHFSQRLYAMWPFNRYPQLLERGEKQFKRNAVKSVIVARYVGPIRPFVPAVAGMLQMPLRKYLPASVFAAITWAAAFLAPGWALGTAYDAIAAIAGKLALVVGLLLLALVLAWSIVWFAYRWLSAHADNLTARVLDWSHAHPLFGRYSEALFDPKRRESVSLALLALLLIVIACACFAFLAYVIGSGGLLGTDIAVNELMHGLRNPLADAPLAALAALGDWQVLVPACALVLLYLLWRRRWLAAWHWLAALAFGLALTSALGALIAIPKPPLAGSGFSFPSLPVTMVTVAFGFFAVLIGRELPGRRRIWPYMLAGLAVTLTGFARLYLGAHWLSDVVGGVLVGAVWLLVLGVAYRRRVQGAMWMKPQAWLFYGTFALAALWHAPRSVDDTLKRFDPPQVFDTTAAAAWWNDGWRYLPAHRGELANTQRWPLDVQYAGDLPTLQRALEAHGWRVQQRAGWVQALQLLNLRLPDEQQPVLPASFDTRAESLLMLHAGDRPGEQYALRLWRAPLTLHAAATHDQALWIGSAQELHYHAFFGLIGAWKTQPQDADAALAVVTASLAGLPQRTEAHPDSTAPVLRVKAL